MKVINLFGAPGAGKSTTMLGLTYRMKMMGLSVENTPEYFKELVLEEGHHAKFGGQIHVLTEQNRRLARLLGKNDFAITDCPLPLIGYYTPANYFKGFSALVKQLNNEYDNVNYIILRKHEFENEKRAHNEQQSDEIAVELPKYLKKNGIKFKIVDSSEDLVEILLQDLINEKIIKKKHLAKSRNKEVRQMYETKKEKKHKDKK